MIAPATNDVLNRRLAIHNRSLPVYLSDAAPWTHQGDEQAAAALVQITAAHRIMVDRIGDFLIERDGMSEAGAFPSQDASWHDLTLDFLLARLVQAQEQNVAAIAQCVDQLTGEPMAKALAQEALGEAKGHLESLEEMVKQPS